MRFPSQNELKSLRKARLTPDLVAVVIIPILFLVLAIIFNLFDRLAAWLESVEAWQIDEFLFSVVVLSLMLIWFAYRRWRDLQAEIAGRKQAEQARADEYNLLRTLIDNLPDLIYAKDIESRFTLVNHTSLQMNQRTMAEIIGKTDFEINPPEIATQYYADDQAVIRSGQPLIDREEPNKDVEGRVHWFSTTKLPLRNSNGQIIGLIGISRHITRHKEMEEALRQAQVELEKRVEERTAELSQANAALRQEIAERQHVQEGLQQSEERFRQLAENIDEVFLLTVPGHDEMIYLSPAYELVWGRTRQSRYEKTHTFLDTVHPEDRERVRSAQEKDGQGEQEKEYRIVRPDGSIRWIRSRTFPVRNELGETYRIAGIAEDITARKQTREALQQAEQRYRQLFEEAPVMYVIFRTEAGQPIVTDCNQLFLTTLGYSRAEVLGRPLADFYTPGSRVELAAGGYQRTLTGEFVVEERQLLTRDGQIVETLLQALSETDPDGEARGARAMFVNISKRKLAEAQIRRRNQELGLLNQIIAASTANLEIETMLETTCRELALAFDLPQVFITLFNEKRTEMTVVAEYAVEARPALLHQTMPLTGRRSLQYLTGYDTPLVINDAQSDSRFAQLRDLLGQRGVVTALLLPLIVNGQVIGRLSLEAVEPRTFPTEEINLAWSVTDQLAGALARARLIQTQQRLTTVIEQSVESVIITDTDGIIIYVNPAFERISGYSRAEVLGQNFRTLYKLEEQEQASVEQSLALLSSGQVWQGRVVSRKKDGSFYTEDIILSPVRDENEAIVNYVAVKRDVTHELQLEEQYRQSQKMEAVGQLAGGIAHDFNNLLTVINGYSELLLLRYLKENDPSRKYLEEIQRAGERASTLTRQLLAFSRKQILQLQILDLNTVVAEMDKMFRRLISEDIDLDTQLAPDLAPIKADRGQVEQVLLNLVVNARDAMPRGGKLTLETANVRLDQNYADEHAEVTPGEYVLLAVSDTGIGMTEEIKARIFEPFFTTKEEGKGTGLGLATCFGIVKQSGGHIGVYSEPGLGTTFKIYLACAVEVTKPLIEPDQPETLPRGTETILLVEDVTVVRALAARLLHEQGYTVLEAANGEEALRLTRTQTRPEIHLLLTDVVMPQMNGKKLADQLKIENSRIKVLFTSGYTDDAIVRHGVLEPGIAFLEKPFSMDALARKVRQVLDT